MDCALRILNQTGGVVASGTLDWAGAANLTGTGTTAASTLTLTGTSSRNLQNGVLENRGTFNALADASLVNNGGVASTFANSGVFNKSKGATKPALFHWPLGKVGGVWAVYPDRAEAWLAERR